MNNNTVYQYTNMINGKIYIGRTSQSIKSRAGKNGKGYCTSRRFWNAICKYGWNNFKLTILATDLSFEESVNLEKHYIEFFGSYNDAKGYNILKQEPGEGFLSEETKKKISDSHIGLRPGMHKREKRTNKYIRTEEHCKHISESLKGNVPWNKGIKTGPLTEIQKAKFSEARKGNTNSIHKPVKNITTGEIYRSGAEAARAVNCSRNAIYDAINKNHPCKGFVFAWDV